jgi:mannose-1-phosphate guanylyltransferase/mannose-6-phosphate isomerase
MKIHPIILSGGSGTRLWPLSRKQYPKQYLPLADDQQTMLQATIQRLQGLENIASPSVICNTEHRFLVAEQLHQIGIDNANILLEPVGKNTASAIAAAAYYFQIQTEVKDALMLILSADHVIQNIPAFHQAINTAVQQAEKAKLVTFGIIPTEPHTGYGYIKMKTPYSFMEGDWDGIKEGKAQEIQQFKEKPNQKTAQKYLDQGNYLWNSGMFLFSTETLLKELQEHSPETIQASQQAVLQGTKDHDFYRLQPFPEKLQPLSIDYALMEKTDQAVVIPLDAGWSDVGSWSALYEIGNKDQQGNHLKGDVIVIESTNCYINADHHMVAAIGVEGLIIVDTPDATLVSTRGKAEQVKQVVEQLQQQSRCEEDVHRKVYRPWGWYDSIDHGKRFQVKRICVNPGASLSLQKHYHRAEHWIVVKGTAKITNGGQREQLLTEDQSTYIPKGELHRLENPGKLPLEIIEIQSGEYLDEDDIVRFDDQYGR